MYQVTCAPSLSVLHTPFVCLGNGDFERLHCQTSDYLCQSVNEVFPAASCVKCVIPGGNIGSLCRSRGCVTGGCLFLSSSSKTSVACVTPWFYCQYIDLDLCFEFFSLKFRIIELSHHLAQAGGAGVSTLGHLLRLYISVWSSWALPLILLPWEAPSLALCSNKSNTSEGSLTHSDNHSLVTLFKKSGQCDCRSPPQIPSIIFPEVC